TKRIANLYEGAPAGLSSPRGGSAGLSSLCQPPAAAARPCADVCRAAAPGRIIAVRFAWSGRWAGCPSEAVDAGGPKWIPKLAALLAYEQVKAHGGVACKTVGAVTRLVGQDRAPVRPDGGAQ